MSDARQTQIVEAVKRAADLHVEGLGATEAIAKCAGEIDANPHVLQRMVEAFNTSKTLAHLRSADEMEKAASFELADYEAARDILFPRGERAKAARASLEVGELPWFAEPQVKTAADHEDLFRIDDTEAPQFDPERRYKLAYRSIDQLRKQADLHRTEGSKYQQIFEQSIRKLASIFRAADRPDWQLFESEAVAVHKEACAPFLDAAYAEGRLGSVKCARERVQTSIYINTDTEPHKLLKVAMYAADLAAEEFATSQKFAEQFEGAKADLQKVAVDPLIGMAAWTAANKMLDDKFDELHKAEQKTYDLDPEVGIESELGKAKLQALVREMMEGDDVVAQHARENPQRITQTIQELSKVSPKILQSPMVLRSGLRRHLEMGQLEPFELEQLQKVTQPRRNMPGEAK